MNLFVYNCPDEMGEMHLFMNICAMSLKGGVTGGMFPMQLKPCKLRSSSPKGSSYCKLGRSGNFVNSGWVNTALSLLSVNATFPLPSLTCPLMWSGKVVPGARASDSGGAELRRYLVSVSWCPFVRFVEKPMCSEVFATSAVEEELPITLPLPATPTHPTRWHGHRGQEFCVPDLPSSTWH